MVPRSLLLGLAATLWALPATALVPGDLLLVEGSTLFHYELATGVLRVVSSPDVGTGPVFADATDVDVLRFGWIAVAADAVFLVDPNTGDRIQLSEPLGARQVHSLRDGRIVARASDSTIQVIDPATGEATQLVRYFGDSLDGFDVTWDQKLLVNVFAAIREYDPATNSTITISADRASSAPPRGSGPNLGILLDVVAGSGNDAFVLTRDTELVHVQRDSGDREVVVAAFGPGTGAPWFVNEAGVDMGLDGTPVVVARRPIGTLAAFYVDVATQHRTVVDLPTVSVEGVPFEDADGFASVPEDDDGDLTPDRVLDVCPGVFDPAQRDTDGDGVGDACNDADDRDGDEFSDSLDDCPDTRDVDQRDTDHDGVGDACNDAADADGDEFRDDLDNCPAHANDQADADGDGLGDVCDPFPGEPDNEKGQLRADLARCLDQRPFVDADGDGEDDATDDCPETPQGAPVDSAGCSAAQFCGRLDAAPAGIRVLTCAGLDWRNDEPLLWRPHDCELAFAAFPDLRCTAR